LYQKQIADKKREQKKQDTARRKEEKNARVAERLAAKKREQQERDAATLQKSQDTREKASQTTSRGAVKKTRQGSCAHRLQEEAKVVLLPPPLSPKVTTRGQQI
jgi:hypothetical protein